jgi:hypothetical protein
MSRTPKKPTVADGIRLYLAMDAHTREQFEVELTLTEGSLAWRLKRELFWTISDYEDELRKAAEAAKKRNRQADPETDRLAAEVAAYKAARRKGNRVVGVHFNMSEANVRKLIKRHEKNQEAAEKERQRQEYYRAKEQAWRSLGYNLSFPDAY